MKKITISISAKEYATFIIMAAIGAAALDATKLPKPLFDAFVEMVTAIIEDEDEGKDGFSTKDELIDEFKSQMTVAMTDGDVERLIAASYEIAKLQ